MSEAAYVPVPVETLVGDKQTEFDLYVQLSSKYVLYLRKGGVFDSARLGKLKEKSVKTLFIQSSDHAIFKAFCDRRTDEAYDPASSLSVSERVALIHRAQIDATEGILKDVTNSGVYQVGAHGAKKLTELLLKDDAIAQSLFAAATRERTIANHGVTVAVLAVSVAKKIGLGASKDLHLLTFGCLLHDAGHYGKPDVVLGQPTKGMSADQIRKFNEHTTSGARQIQEQVHFDQHVIKIVLQHEEYIDGTGFPKGLKDKEMHAYPIIASTANSFDRYLSRPGESYSSALKTFIVEKIGRHPLAHINALKELAKVFEAA